MSYEIKNNDKKDDKQILKINKISWNFWVSIAQIVLALLLARSINKIESMDTRINQNSQNIVKLEYETDKKIIAIDRKYEIAVLNISNQIDAVAKFIEEKK